MDDIINLLIFVGTIAIFIVSAVIKAKKKPVVEGSSKASSFFENLLGVDESNSKSESIADEKFYENQQYIKPEQESMKSRLSGSEEGIDAIPDVDPIKQGEIADKKDDVEFDFNLREAVLYTEILKRKEY